ncbi:hypothetical protein GFV12_03050 [Desulfurobacterium thermolithotrophum]|uniref:hypothetical protein n=1 Tax=Desulfurobacterium thermolithotrophum TaxID=64160 RepID=UPI0013D79205|nr:hypothetical protein [Desulfurobacterium thermolithotrophum]
MKFKTFISKVARYLIFFLLQPILGTLLFLLFSTGFLYFCFTYLLQLVKKEWQVEVKLEIPFTDYELLLRVPEKK